ncbi:hypothetical protein C8Q76DRAFT_569598, partial [Earliella scabrosa]
FDADADKEAAAEGEDERELAELMRDMEVEEIEAQQDDAGEEREADDPDDEVDAMADLTEEERAQFKRDVRPVKLVLAKLRKLAFKIIHSTTILLPAWKRTLVDLGLPIRLLPRDVRTRWNSTFDMLDAALKHRAAVERMCGEKGNKL